MKQFFSILILITSFVIAPLAVAGDLIISRAVLEDSAGTLTIADVAGREFKPVGPTLSKGITKSVYWLRLGVQAPSTGSKAVLLIRQPFLNEVRLFEADTSDPQGWKTRVTGNYYPFSDRDRATSSLSSVS